MFRNALRIVRMPALATLALVALASIAQPADAGRIPGPGFDIERVDAHSTVTYQILFEGGRPAQIVVDGDGDTDLDLYIYDEYGNLVASDTDLTDFCVASWMPRWTGVFEVRVVNLGSVWNQYELQTN